MYLEILIKNLNSLCYLFDSKKKSWTRTPVYGTKDMIKISYRENMKRETVELTYSEAVDMIRQETSRLQLPVEYEQAFE